MTHHSRHTLLLLLATFLLALSAAAQSVNIRYVRTDGDNSKDGLSWATAKKDIQNAINDLAGNNLTGEVWVAAGKYYPTETTESTTSLYYKAFKIPAGITVRGGFDATHPETTLAARAMTADKNFGATGQSVTIDGESFRSGVYTNKTILCGDITPGKSPQFTWNENKLQFDAAFYGNSYHVVWFAMNGFDAKGRANPLAKPAKLEGCVIEGGHANNREVLAEHPHTAYGGGIYMVLNSFVYNCEVKNCDASRNGGGIYMDGGGVVRRTYVHDCQALGLGTDFGYGGGICQNGGALTAKARPCVVAQSVVTNCVGRMGGGIGIMADQAVGNGKYAVVSNSTLVNNCTATIEGGGVYTYKGGGVASLTIVNNKCNGSGITQNGTLTGRSGGLYSYDASYVANTVLWGNKCEANNDVQFASSISNLTGAERIKFFYNAVSNADNTDWSSTTRMGVVALDNANNTTGTKGSLGYPLFSKPTTEAGYLASATTDNTINWKVSSESSLTFAGVATIDLDTEGETPAPEHSWDMQLGKFNSRPTIGAFVSQKGNIAPATDITYNSTTYNYAIFVDPEFVYAADNTGTNGATWEHPVRFLGNALDYIKDQNYDAGKKVAIFVKEGTVDNTRDAGADRIRITSLDIPSNVSVFGSFDSDLEDTDLTLQNVVHTPTIISARLMDQYNYNVAHLVNIDSKSNIHFEGFKLSFANASSTDLANTNKNGAAITLTNSSNITFRNIIVSNCTADRGAAVYADHTTATRFDNCIFHNNESKVLDNSGIIYATNGSALTFDHCDVLRNVGHASYLGTNSTTNNWTNSIFYGNMNAPMPDTNSDMGGGIEKALEAFSGTTANATGDHCMFDSKSASFSTQFGGNDTGNQWQYNLQYAFVDGTGRGYPRFINPTKNAGVTVDGDQTYYGRATSFEPHNNNPVVNMGAASGAHDTWGEDIISISRNYGGLPDIGAVENHEETKGVNAYKDGQKAYGSLLYVRDYNTYNDDGTIQTTDANTENRDGTSWARAINGNATYTLRGTHKYKTTTSGSETIFKGFRIYDGSHYLAVNNGTLNRINVTDSSLPSDYTPDPEDPEAWNPIENAGVFMLCDNTGSPLDRGDDKTTAKYIKDASTGMFLYLDYMYGTYSFRTSVNPPVGQAEVTIASPSTDVYTFAFTAKEKTRYLSNNKIIPSTEPTNWSFSDPVTETHDYKTGEVASETYNMGTFTGLQYAVNLANIMYNDDVLAGKDPQQAKKQVWVGAGIYKRDPAKNTGTTPSTPIVEMDEENCFIIQDGVDVYGAFPKAGNPGMNEREALVSKYVHVQTADDGVTPLYDYHDFETILEPLTATGVVSGVRHRVLGQPYKYNPDVGNNDTRKKNNTPLYCGTDYIGVVWDGFTLRNGVWDSKGLNRPNRYGGAGAAIYRNVTLKNVVVTNNTTIYTGAGSSQDFRAGGIYMDGGTLDAGYVINNELLGWTSSGNKEASNGAAYGAGMYIYTGTVFNSVIANNRVHAAYADGAGTFIEMANFFNNTIVNNHAEGTQRMVAGIAVWTDPKKVQSVLNIYNTISVNNEGYKGNTNTKQSDTGNKNVAIQNGGRINLYNCITEDITSSEKNKPSSAGPAIITYDQQTCIAETTPANLFVNLGTYQSAFKDLNLRLNPSKTKAINNGNDSPEIGGAVYNLVDYNDMDFTERIQDCRIDIGAYEFNGATGITPDVTPVSGQAIYYVTPNGYGTTNAHDPENAACAEKLQRVLDAAGRYKYLNPEKQVIVKVANSYDLLHPTSGEPTNFTYYATRTTDWTDQDVRVWSIIVPRGVEVWGGYTDVPVDVNWEKTGDTWDNTHNGFVLSDGKTDHRNITKNPTYFDSYYVNKLEKTDANTYHVVSFTDRLFDLNGYAYTTEDFKDKTADQICTILQNGSASKFLQLLDNDESHFVHMSKAIDGVSTGVTGNAINIGTAQTPKYASNRAVVDGIFISGGQADAPANSTNTTVNINSYGGAALVNDYAYVRNCILIGNTAINGGALALTDHALVSGCLIMDNEAHNEGGGIYVFEEGTKLSNGTTINSLRQPGDQTMDFNMAHVLTSTIVQNSAQRGGGVWFSNQNHESVNVRFNSVAIWQNKASEQANVYGMVNPEQPTDDETISEEFYPFCYSAIQNIRASGTNNLDVGAINHQGMRFVEKTSDIGQTTVDQTEIAEEGVEGPAKYDNFGYYGLTEYSLLCSNGMPVSNYKLLKAAIAISDDDILGTHRLPSNEDNIFVEIGARALEMIMPKKQLMLRLFVADPKYVDTEMAVRFMRLNPGKEPADKSSDDHKEWDAKTYYSQVGSSFAYPFNSLQNALDYVKMARDGYIITGNTDARDLPFEIIVGKGTYWPKQSLNAETQNVWSATFAIPEGVTIVGGFNPQGGSGTYYGRYNKAKATINHTSAFESDKDAVTMSIYNNVEPIPTGTQSASGDGKCEIGRGYKSGEEQVTLPAFGGSAEQPITFLQWDIQDICDRRAMADNNKNGIIEPWEFANQTIISGNAVNGETDGVYHIMTAVADADAVGNLPAAGYLYDQSFTDDGYHCHEYGQQIRLNGLIITGGNALTYLSTALDEYGKYMFYHGAGLLVDGNRYKANIDAPSVSHTEPTFHNSAAYGVGYRDIPISVINCQFRNNKAGYGGAISTNGTLDTYASSFEQNLAIGQTEEWKSGEKWFTMVNGSRQDVTRVMYPGQGGAIHATSQLSCYNTLFANNEARLGDGEIATIDLVKHPTFRVPLEGNASATLRAAGGAIMVGTAGRYHMMNCDFVRNKANAYPVIFTMNPNSTEDEKGKDEVTSTENYNQIVSTVVWGNEVNPEMLKMFKDNPYYQFASKMMVNVGKRDRGGADDYPAYSPTFTEGNVPSSQADLDQNWKEFVWFSAYEDGVGFTQKNTYDLRDHIIFKTGQFVNWNIKAAAKEVNPSLPVDYFQNCNIQIVAKNDDVAGPNFGNPSYRAGYDGFMEGADWSPTRFNRLTDNGSGWIKQSVASVDTNGDGKKDDYLVTFPQTPDAEHKDEYYQGGYPVAHYDTYSEYKLWLAIGNEKYMQATNETEKDEIFINNTSIGNPQKNYPRISPDPTIGMTRAYIDIGVYEYQKHPLLKPGNEVDILWVSTKEHPENGEANGHTWKTPTSDLQRAINTLLSSRNGHKKEIRIMEGEYAPVTPQTIGSTKYNAFVIDTKSLNEATITPTGFTDGNNNNQYYAQSLTIKGGYSQDIMYEHDPAQYKTVIRQNKGADGINSDHLIYIKDPTMRYAYSTAENYASNNDGATFGSNTSAESYTARTMPIQLDGITLINDAAAANTTGSAIFYPDVTGITESHSISVGGKVVYYETKEEMDKVDGSGNHIGTTVDHETEFALITTEGAGTITNPAKIVITKTQVVGSGKPNVVNTGSAVYIGQNGGSALIYNSVFHSNYGMPLDAYNTVNVNNTFGLNAGKVQLRDVESSVEPYPFVKSQMHNSVLWRNNGDGDQFSLPNVTVSTADDATKGNVSGTGIANLTYNAFTGGKAEGGYVEGNKFNVGLVDTNFDIGNGPNFVDPENVDIEARNFDIKPSVRLLNKGNGTRTPAVAPETDTYAGLYNEMIVSQKYDYSLASTYDKDVLYRTRIVGSGSPLHIDLGAYEFQGGFVNPLYVDPNKAHSDAATGENWDKAFGYGDIQSAMDLAALYHIDNPSKEAYVFVKGASATNQGMHTNEELSIRDGVTVYGSIISTYSDWHGMKVDEVLKYNDGSGNPDIPAFIKDMASIREGVASHTASKTTVSGIKTPANSTYDGNSGTTPALMDGFIVTATGKPTAPVLDVTNASPNAVTAVRNVIVADNNMASGIDVAQVSNGLLYEALFRDNTTNGAALRISTKGYAVNVTVEGKTIDAEGQSRVDTDGGQIFNSITNSINSGTGANAAGAAAPYRAITNKDISGYFYNIGDANLNYQLTETSKYIDACDVNEASTDGEKHPGFLPANLAKFITYTTDRDLLGNPRLLTGVTTAVKIDRGAFETWKVKNDGNTFVCGELGTIAATAYNATYNNADHAIIKKHFYPHDGSVCYIMEGQSLVIDPFDPAHEVKPTPHNPGFMLVQEGGNFYGNGRPATCAYVSVERTINKEHGSIVSMPFDMKYGTDVTQPRYTDDCLTSLQTGVTDGIYCYDGSKRSVWNYIFEPSASPCWSPLAGDAANVEANHGVLVTTNAAGSGSEVTLRFTAKGNDLKDYIYTEEGVFKTVTLTQYDDKQSTDGAADFTKKEDMGWNCIGLPYLVSDYRPYEKVNAADGKTKSTPAATDPYRMDIPHTLWLYYDGVKSPDAKDVNGDGGYYSVNSWEKATTFDVVTDNPWRVQEESDQRIWVGEGIFTQTATVFDSETLTFYLPDPTASGASPSNRRNIRFYFDDDDDAADDDNGDDSLAPTLLHTEYYSVAGRRLARPDAMGVTIVRRIYSDGTVRSFKTR